MLIFGTLPKICFAGGMTSLLFERKIRIFDYPKFAEPFRNRIRENAEKLAAEAGIEIEFIRKRNFRKEHRVKQIIAERGDHAGLVCIFSAMEPCSTYKPWHNKQTGKTYLATGFDTRNGQKKGNVPHAARTAARGLQPQPRWRGLSAVRTLVQVLRK